MRKSRTFMLLPMLWLLATPLSAFADGAAASKGASVETERLRFVLPAGWQRVDPSSKMRVAQASIPGAAGAGELAVFYFGPGQGGSVDANLQRWVAQMELAPNVAPKPAHFDANGCTVTWIDVAGTLKPSSMGMGPATAQPGSRLLGAVIEGPGGPWFFKATGPDQTLAAERENFLALLKSATPQ